MLQSYTNIIKLKSLFSCTRLSRELVVQIEKFFYYWIAHLLKKAYLTSRYDQ